MKLFPFKLYAHETDYFTSSPHELMKAFIDNKPPELIWYAYNVEIRSRTEVTFTVFDIRDNVHGGIGHQVAEFDAIVDPSVLENVIATRALYLARKKREEELRDIEEIIVAAYAAEILKNGK